MKLEINGKLITTKAATLALLLKEQDFDPLIVATAVDGEFIPKDKRADTPLKIGQKIEILSPRQGG